MKNQEIRKTKDIQRKKFEKVLHFLYGECEGSDLKDESDEEARLLSEHQLKALMKIFDPDDTTSRFKHDLILRKFDPFMKEDLKKILRKLV